jgi:hypothetical protein
MQIKRTFDLSFSVTDPEALLTAAAERLVEQNTYDSVDDALSELNGNLDEAARILLDPGQLPGIEIFDSSCSPDPSESLQS